MGSRTGLDTEARGEILSPLPEVAPQSPGRPIRSQTLLTELPRPLKAINRGGKVYLSSGFFYTIGMRKRCPTNRVRESFVISILEVRVAEKYRR
jgi:hypothetical protein